MSDFYNPYETVNHGKWYKSSFHIHHGTGEETLPTSCEIVMRAYKEAGYDFIMLSQQPCWEDTSELAAKVGIHTVNGTEYIGQDGILLMGTRSFIGGEPQEAVDECVRQGGLAVICHPNWETEPDLPLAMPAELRDALTGVTGIEIVTAAIFDRFLGSGYAADVWDKMLTAGKVIWAFGSDDFHLYHDLARAWVQIYSNERYSWDSMKRSIQLGALYVSTGLKLFDYGFNGNVLKIQADYPGKKLGRTEYRFIGESGVILSQCFGDSASYNVLGSEKYIRVEARGESGQMLWTQPLLNRDFYSVLS